MGGGGGEGGRGEDERERGVLGVNYKVHSTVQTYKLRHFALGKVTEFINMRRPEASQQEMPSPSPVRYTPTPSLHHYMFANLPTRPHLRSAL